MEGSHTMAKRTGTASADPRSPIQGIRACLEQLYDEASTRGLTLAAVLIGAASEAVTDEEAERATKTSAQKKHAMLER